MSGSRLFSAEPLSQIAAHVSPHTSVIFAWWTQAPAAASAGAERGCGILDVNEQDLEELDSALAELEPNVRALYALRYCDLVRPETGLFVAKRPNELGATPIGGAY